MACFYARMIPLPIDLVSMFFGASGVNYPFYVVCSLLGLSPYLVPYILAGENIGHILSSQFLVPFAVSFAFASGIFLVAGSFWKKDKENVV